MAPYNSSGNPNQLNHDQYLLRLETNNEVPDMQISDMNTPGKDFHKEFFDSTQKKPQLMPVEVNENDNNNRSSLPSGKESLPDFDKLPHIED